MYVASPQGRPPWPNNHIAVRAAITNTKARTTEGISGLALMHLACILLRPRH
jgi:hypothetical protein